MSNNHTLVCTTWQQMNEAVKHVRDMIQENVDLRNFTGVYGEPRGGLILAVMLSHLTGLPLLLKPEMRMIWVDDIVDNGNTLRAAKEIYGDNAFYVTWFCRENGTVQPDVFFDTAFNGEWIVFPWEDIEKAEEDFNQYVEKRKLTALFSASANDSE
jgi:hypoxanthine phosphoribosyltransferase